MFIISALVPLSDAHLSGDQAKLESWLGAHVRRYGFPYYSSNDSVNKYG